jgi:Rrf2 family nitric oxide-sensitive transcriptional repressor
LKYGILDSNIRTVQLTDHTDFGLRVLMSLGAASPRRLSTREIAERHGLSFAHVQKVVQSLEGAGLVRTFRGRDGGVDLARPPEDVTIGGVVRALEPHFDLVRCLRPGPSGCMLAGGCGLTGTLLRARSAFLAELDGTTLADVIASSPRAGVVSAGAPAPRRPRRSEARKGL